MNRLWKYYYKDAKTYRMICYLWLIVMLSFAPFSVCFSQKNTVRRSSEKSKVERKRISKNRSSRSSNNTSHSSIRDIRPRTVSVGKTVTTDIQKWRLVAIEVKSDLTICHWTVTNLTQDLTGVYGDDTPYIKDNSTGRIYRIIDHNGLGTKSKPRVLGARQTIEFETFFPALPIGISNVNYNMGTRTIYNIDIK